MKRNTALVAGASGLIGRRIAEHLIAAGNWDVIALARRAPALQMLTRQFERYRAAKIIP